HHHVRTLTGKLAGDGLPDAAVGSRHQCVSAHEFHDRLPAFFAGTAAFTVPALCRAALCRTGVRPAFSVPSMPSGIRNDSTAALRRGLRTEAVLTWTGWLRFFTILISFVGMAASFPCVLATRLPGISIQNSTSRTSRRPRHDRPGGTGETS